MSDVSAADLAQLRASVAEFLTARSPESEIRRIMETSEGYDPSVWATMADELGLQGLAVPEEFGGSGFGFAELAVVLGELGRGLYPGPFLATAVAVTALVRGETGAFAKAHLPAIAAGETVAAFAVAGSSAGRVATPTVHAAGGALSGNAVHVIDGHLDGVLVVEVAEDSGRALYAVEPSSPGLTRDLVETTDRTRRLASIAFDQVPAIRLGGSDHVDWLRAVACSAIACGQVGGAEAALHSAIGYAMVRTQFGKPIGSFQSIKHLCAEGFAAVEAAKAAARRSAAAIAAEESEVDVLSAIAKAWCSDTYANVADANLHIHGGVGFTWEHSAHLHLKRAKTDEVLLGDSRHHRARLAEILGI